MGRTGTAGAGITRERALPEGVKLIGEYYYFQGEKVSKSFIEARGYKLTSANPFELFSRDIKVQNFAYNPYTYEFVIGGAMHASLIAEAKATPRYDNFAKGYYMPHTRYTDKGVEKEGPLIHIFSTRFIPRRDKTVHDMIFDTADVLKKFLPAHTFLEIDAPGFKGRTIGDM